MTEGDDDCGLFFRADNDEKKMSFRMHGHKYNDLIAIFLNAINYQGFREEWSIFWSFLKMNCPLIARKLLALVDLARKFVPLL